MIKATNPSTNIISMKRPKPEGEEEFKLVSVEALSLSGSFWSKKDIYDFMQIKLYHLPPFKETDMRKIFSWLSYWLYLIEFLKDILRKKKLVFKSSEIKKINIP